MIKIILPVIFILFLVIGCSNNKSEAILQKVCIPEILANFYGITGLCMNDTKEQTASHGNLKRNQDEKNGQ